MSIPARAIPAVRDFSWLDAETPRGGASRRRWTVACTLLLVLLGVTVSGVERFGLDGDELPLLLFVAPAVVFGMLRRGTRRLAASDHPDLDERDVAALGGAFRVAFPLLVVATIAGIVLLGLALPSTKLRTDVGPDSFELTHGWFATGGDLAALAAWVVIWATFLPTAVLAWREPDPVEFDDAAPRPSEALRDALLGAVIAGGLVWGLATGSQIGLVAVLVVTTALGTLRRRATGEPVLSRAGRRWLAVAAVFVLLGVALLYSVAGGATGSETGQPVGVR